MQQTHAQAAWTGEMSKKAQNSGFDCENCGAAVLAVTNGSYRNHCPFCLHSLHVDETPGDRRSSCGALMPPVGITRHNRKGPQIVHRCSRCCAESVNRVASDTVQPDDAGILEALPEPGRRLDGRRRSAAFRASRPH